MDKDGTLIDQAVGDMAAIYVRLQELNMPVWLKLDLTMAQFRAMVVVNRHPGITVGELGAQLSVCQSASSLLADQLVRRGLVERAEDPADRRRALLSCTPAGEAQLTELRRGNQQVCRGWLATLDDDQMAGLSRGLSVLVKAAR